MVATGIQPEELTVQHMGKPGQRVPDTHVPGGESPGKPIPGEATFDHGINTDEHLIVENKLMGPHLFKNKNGKQDENQAE